MKIKFDAQQQYQIDAVSAVVDIFDGQPLHQGDFEFGYSRAFRGEIPGAYERLLLDFLEGDQRLFIRSDEIEASWAFVDSIAENPEFNKLPLYQYRPGSAGPKEADEWIKKDIKEWWTK